MASSHTASALDLHIANRLKLARLHAGVSGATVGAAIGVVPQQYSRYERAENRVSASMLYRLGRFFKVPVSWFYLGFDDQSDPQLADLGEPLSDYRVASDEEELAILVTNWRRLSARQKDSVFNLLNSIADRQ